MLAAIIKNGDFKQRGGNGLQRYIITMGDFLKNAGIVGLKYLLDSSGAEKDRDYGLDNDKQTLWIDHDFAVNADWTDLYFKACVKYFGPMTVYQGILDRIQSLSKMLEEEDWKVTKNFKDELKFINDKLLSNSYKNGFENIKEFIEKPEIYIELNKNKLSDKEGREELLFRLRQLQDFLAQPLCKETFAMKSIVYTYINRFWNGKSFLLSANAKKDMRQTFEKDFSEPLKKYFNTDHSKAKEMCIDCGLAMSSKERVSIAFMNEMADDLSRKRSAFWNCKVDAYLCPLCAYVYSLAPLGFQLYSNKFVFINQNENIEALIDANSKREINASDTGKGENEKYSAWFARLLNTVLKNKAYELSNIQVVLRGIRAEDSYMLSIIHEDAVKILSRKEVQSYLEKIAKSPYVKVKDDFINVHEVVIMNILQYRNQYGLLNKLLKESVAQDAVPVMASLVYKIQLWTNIVRKNNENGVKIFMSRIAMCNSGYDLRKSILASKGAATDECLRGTIYKLVNALAVKNQEKFMDIIIRLYSSSKYTIPNGFVYMLGDKDRFEEYGYAFILGLKGCHNNEEGK